MTTTRSPGGGGASLASTLAAFAASASGLSSVSGPVTSGSTLPPAYIIVCGREGGNAVELPLDREGALSLKTLQIEFSDATGVKYR